MNSKLEIQWGIDMGVEIRRMICGRSFWMAVLLGVCGIVVGASWPELEGLLETGSFLALEKEALTSQIVSFLLPVTAVLPWCDSFLDEWQGGFLKSCLPRMGRRLFVQSKVFSVALGGFLAWMVSGIVVLTGYFIIFFPLEKKGNFPAEQLLALLELLLRGGLLCAVLASAGGLCAVLTGSSYMAYGLPFVGYYFCIILHDRYFAEALWLYPKEWLAGTAAWGENRRGLWLFLLLLLGTVMGIHGGVLYGRLEEL